MTVAMLMPRVSFVNSVNNNDASRLMESVAAISDRWNNRRSCVGSSLWFSESQWIGVLAMLARVQATSGQHRRRRLCCWDEETTRRRQWIIINHHCSKEQTT